MRRDRALPRAVLAVVLLVLTVATAGCAGHGSAAAPTPTARVTPTRPPAPSPAPTTGSCYAMSFAQASRPTGGGRGVPCSGAHTAITYRTGTLRAVQDGHLMAVDSTTVQSRLAATCPSRLGAYLGADRDRLRLSRFEAVWFSPTLIQADRGARWYRCDVVALASKDRLAPLPRTLRGVLTSAAGLGRWGICGTASPSAAGFAQVICSSPHAWRAISVVDLPAGTRYLGKPATAQGNAACKDAASARADGALQYSWSFQWPGPDQWRAGARYGLCWVPDRA